MLFRLRCPPPPAPFTSVELPVVLVSFAHVCPPCPLRPSTPLPPPPFPLPPFLPPFLPFTSLCRPPPLPHHAAAYSFDSSSHFPPSEQLLRHGCAARSPLGLPHLSPRGSIYKLRQRFPHGTQPRPPALLPRDLCHTPLVIGVIYVCIHRHARVVCIDRPHIPTGCWQTRVNVDLVHLTSQQGAGKRG